MARPRSELHALLKGLEGVKDAYFQAPTTMEDPCIIYERASSRPTWADNVKYLFKKGYTVIVVDRDPDSPIPDLVEALPDCRFNRFYRTNGLNHYAFDLFF